MIVRFFVMPTKKVTRTRPASPSKARKILSDKKIRGKKLTPAQRGLFGRLASGKPVTKLKKTMRKKRKAK